MILTCASCLTRYHADDGAIGPAGRTVRCASCGHTWFAEPALTLDAAPAGDSLTRERVERMRKAASAAPGPAPSAAARFRAQQNERMRKERVRAAAFAWAGTGAALAASATGAVFFRDDVAEMWPRSASAFAALGFEVNVYGLELAGLTVERGFDGDEPVLLVSGEIRNIGHEEKTAPPLRITLRDSEAREVYARVAALDGRAISPGGAMPFEVRVANPPDGAVDLEAAFAAYGEAGEPALMARSPGEEAAEQAPLELGPAHAVAADEDGLRLETSVTTEGHG